MDFEPAPDARPALPGPGSDLLGPPTAASRPGGKPRWVIAVLAAAALILALAGTATAVGKALGGGGPQPEDVLPASTAALAKIDLDPSAGQKVAVFRFARHFPSTREKVRDQDKVRDQLLSALFSDNPDIAYDRDIAPWIGDRVALALVPDKDGPQPVAAIAFDDRAAADRSLPKLVRDQDAHFAFSSKADYVLVGQTQELVDAVARTGRVLADEPAFDKAIDALDGDQIVTAWADFGRVYGALPSQTRDEIAQAYGFDATVQPKGTVVAGVHAEASALELRARALGVSGLGSGSSSKIGTGRGSGLAGQLPAAAAAALSVSSLGDGLAAAIEGALDGQDPFGIVEAAKDKGLRVPEDLPVLFGKETALAVLSQDELGVRNRSDDPKASFAVVSRLVDLFGAERPAFVEQLEDGVVLASDPQTIAAMTDDGDRLADAKTFTRAAPQAKDAAVVGYVDLQRVLELAEVEPSGDTAPLEAVGLTSTTGEKDTTVRLRFTLRD